LALWNENDPILKERLFGLTGREGNHGEDVKECYYYLDATPTYTYAKALYKYPQAQYPYDFLVRENDARGLHQPEFELYDTGIFENNEYFDVFVEYAKDGPDDVLIKVSIHNRGPKAKRIHVLPQLWYRNTWVWGCPHEGTEQKPTMQLAEPHVVACDHETLGRFFFEFDASTAKAPVPLFTENETNKKRLFGQENASKYVKDAFHEYVVSGKKDAVNPERVGTKFAPYYVLEVKPGAGTELRFRLYSSEDRKKDMLGKQFDQVFELRKKEADSFFYNDDVIHPSLTDDEKLVARQSYAGLLWCKQFYHYVVGDWLEGDKNEVPPPAVRKWGRNREWKHVYSRDVISMPDKWEYPWFAAWDLAFHMVPYSDMDPYFAKEQMILLLREWYMHPNGQIPAYEFNFSDVNPPVHAWAAWHIYKSERYLGNPDRAFLESIFQKLLLNFTWWVNRKDLEGDNLFAGGFLGLDNIGVFDRSKQLPVGGHLEQADGTAWMAFYCLNMLRIALELAEGNPAYEDMASKFFEHFVMIADAMNCMGGSGLWDEQDGFYYDQMKLDHDTTRLRTRSLVGLLPMIAVQTLDEERLAKLPNFYRRMQWFLKYRPDLARTISYGELSHNLRLLSIPSRDRLVRLLAYLFDENEFLSPYGIRSLSLYHRDNPYVFRGGGAEHRVEYMPGESDSFLFGGNSNWRGPIWFPMNYLIVESLLRYYHYYGDSLLVEFPTGSGNKVTLERASQEIAQRLSSIFLPDASGRRPCHGTETKYTTDPHWRDLVLFYEYFHADSGKGLGSNHQTGWTALVADLIARDRWDRLVDGARMILECATR
jgi:hypothetical protein